MLVLAPLAVALIGVVIERTMLRWIYKLDHIYGLLLTLGITLVVEGVFRSIFGVSGLPYSPPDALQGATDLGFMILPNYRAWVVVASIAVCRRLVRHREDQARRLPARGYRESQDGRGLRHQRAVDGHADLRFRRGPGRLAGVLAAP